MADGPFSDIRPFEKEETLKQIREKILNPLITQTKSVIDPKVKEIEPIAKGSYNRVEFDQGNKRLTFRKHDSSPQTEINLGPIIPEEFPGLEVTSGSTTVRGIKKFNIKNALLVGAGELATVDLDWDNMVPAHQRYVQFNSGKPGDGDVNLTKIKFAGNTDKISVSGNEITLTVPNDPTEFTAQVGAGTAEKPVTKIRLRGNTSGSSIGSDGVLQIEVPDAGGGGTVVAGGNFQGFFDSLGSIQSNVKDPKNNKSYAFAKDDTLGDQYYTPYMYINDEWTEAPIDPSITYEGTQSGTKKQGVFSIKPDANILIDAKGQLDLSRLRFEGHFIGFFDSADEMDKACPSPVVDRSFGYYKTTTGAYALRAFRNVQGEGNKWISVAPYGTMTLFGDKSGGGIQPEGNFYGIKNNSMVSVDNGVVTIKEISQTGGTIEVKAISKTDGAEHTKDVSVLQFKDGVYVDMETTPGTAIIEHPQRLIDYNATWENDHKDGKYLGNIFYDRTSGSWMGYSVGTGSGDVTPKWTRIIHRDMSSEVKGINSRLPIVTEKVTPGTYGDNRQWEHCGWTYVESAFDVGLTPEDVYKTKGLYIQTYARKGPSDGPSDRPSKRLQVGFIDDASGEVFTRIQDDAAGSTNPFWKEWSKVSMSQADLDKHNTDPHAHRTSHKYYRVYSIDMEYSILKAKGYYLYDKDMLLMADSHGIALNGSQEMVIPYDGEYNLSGKFTIDQFFHTSTGIPAKQWKFEIVRTKKDGSEARYQHVYNLPQQSGVQKDVAMEWSRNNLELKSGDKLRFYLQCMNDGDVATNYPNAKLVPVRSYIVIEDSDTVCGSRIAESFRKTFGVLKQRGDSGISIHRTRYEPSSTQRLYGSDIVGVFETMTKVG